MLIVLPPVLADSLLVQIDAAHDRLHVLEGAVKDVSGLNYAGEALGQMC